MYAKSFWKNFARGAAAFAALEALLTVLEYKDGNEPNFTPINVVATLLLIATVGLIVGGIAVATRRFGRAND
jgi:hypothetical protein